MPKSRRARASYSVPALHRSLDIVEALVGQDHGFTTTEVARRFAIPKSSAFGILQTLTERGYVAKDPDDRYALTLKLFGLGSALIDSLDLRRQLYSLLKELTDKTRITGHIAVLDDGYAVYVEKVEVMGALRLTTRIGKRMPLHSTSIGKALLAFQPEPEIERILAAPALPRLTARTITEASELRRELERVRAAGFASSNEENEEGIRAVAAPIFNHSGAAVAAVNLGGSTLQIRMKDIPALGETVRVYAEQMSLRLGFRGRG